MKRMYEWTRDIETPVDAGAAGPVLERLRDEGRLLAEEVVEEARPDTSPLHDHFIWSDADAADLWRWSQAEEIINGLVVIEQDSHGQVVSAARLVDVVTRPAETPAPPPVVNAVDRPAPSQRSRSEFELAMEAFCRLITSLEGAAARLTRSAASPDQEVKARAAREGLFDLLGHVFPETKQKKAS